MKTEVNSFFCAMNAVIYLFIVYYNSFLHISLRTSIVLIHNNILSKERHECTQNDATIQVINKIYV